MGIGNAVAEEVGEEHVLQRGEGGEQVEGLEDESDLRVAQRGELRIVEPAQVPPEDLHLSRVLAIESAEDVQERRLAGAALALDRDELAAPDFEIEGAEELGAGSARLAGRVRLLQPAQLDHVPVHRCPAGAIATSMSARRPRSVGIAAAVARSAESGSMI